MKTRLFSLIAIVLYGLSFGGLSLAAGESEASAIQLPDPHTMVFEPLTFQAIEPIIEKMKTGLEFWHIQDDTLPLVTLVLDFDAGGALDPVGKNGVADMTAATLIRGGTETMKASEFTDKAALLGFDFNVSPDADFTQISITCLASDLTEAMNMLMDAVQHPVFEQAQVELIRAENKEQIKRMEQEPFFQAFNTLQIRIYGENHPKARIPSQESLDAITREDLLSFHKDFYKPDIARFAVLGSVDDSNLKLLKKTLQKWKGKSTRNTDWPAPEPVSDKATIILVDRPGTQAVIAMGHLGLEPGHPYRYDLDIFNEIYGGGGLSSRLMNLVRTRKGLAYVVFGSHVSSMPKGMFMAACMTRNETVVEAIETILSVTREMQSQPVSAEELKKTIESLENSFIFKFERPRQILQRMLINRRMGLPESYLRTYLENIRKVTPESIQKAAAETIFTDKLQIVVAGPADILKTELEKLGLPMEIVSRK